MASDAAEATHLRQLIEAQPAPLMRIRRDGVLLACNDAGLALLGTDKLSQVLDRAFVEHLAPPSHESWREFVERVSVVGAGSLECGLASEVGEARTILFHATALRDHPDGAESVLIAARDMSGVHRLEEALENAQTVANRSLEETHRRLKEVETELARASDENRRLAAELEERRAEDGQEAEADEPFLQRIAQLDAELRTAFDDKARLESLVDAAARERRLRDAEYLAALGQLKHDLDRAREEIARQSDIIREEEVALREMADLRQALADAQAGLERTVEEQRQLTAALGESDLARQRLDDALQRRESEGERGEAALRAAEREELIASLQGEVAMAIEDQQRVRRWLAGAEAEHQRLVAGRAADRAEAERTLGEAIFKKNEVLRTLADQQVELRQWFDQACTLEPLAAAGRLAVDVARELQPVLEKVDDRARFLLGLSHLEASYRPEVEELCAEVLRAASLARQLAAAGANRATAPSAPPDTAEA